MSYQQDPIDRLAQQAGVRLFAERQDRMMLGGAHWRAIAYAEALRAVRDGDPDVLEACGFDRMVHHSPTGNVDQDSWRKTFKR